MATVLQTLKELHAVLVELAEVRDQLRRAPAQLEAKKKDVARREGVHAASQDDLKKFKVTIHEKEVSLKAGEQKVRDLKAKLNQVKTNKEYSLLLDEIKNVQAANSVIEDETLGLFGEQETKTAALAELAKQVETARKELADLEKTVEYTLTKMSDRVGLLEAEQAKFEELLDPQTRTDYRRLLKTKGERTLAEVVDATCQGCHTGLIPQQINDLIMNRVVFCKSCGAMLYSG